MDIVPAFNHVPEVAQPEAKSMPKNETLDCIVVPVNPPATTSPVQPIVVPVVTSAIAWRARDEVITGRVVQVVPLKL